MSAISPLRYRLMTQSTLSMSLEDYHLDIKSEIEGILNQICVQYNYGTELKELNQSLLSYGLPDDLKWAPYERLQDPDYHLQLAKIIENHEPRLMHCSVYSMEEGLKKQQLTLMIEGDVEFLNRLTHWQCIAYCQPIQRRFQLS